MCYFDLWRHNDTTTHKSLREFPEGITVTASCRKASEAAAAEQKKQLEESEGQAIMKAVRDLVLMRRLAQPELIPDFLFYKGRGEEVTERRARHFFSTLIAATRLCSRFCSRVLCFASLVCLSGWMTTFSLRPPFLSLSGEGRRDGGDGEDVRPASRPAGEGAGGKG